MNEENHHKPENKEGIAYEHEDPLIRILHQIIRHAVRGMLPKNRLGRSMIRKLKIYATNEHPHKAQKPEALGLGD